MAKLGFATGLIFKITIIDLAMYVVLCMTKGGEVIETSLL